MSKKILSEKQIINELARDGWDKMPSIIPSKCKIVMNYETLKGWWNLDKEWVKCYIFKIPESSLRPEDKGKPWELPPYVLSIKGSFARGAPKEIIKLIEKMLDF